MKTFARYRAIYSTKLHLPLYRFASSRPDIYNYVQTHLQLKAEVQALQKRLEASATPSLEEDMNGMWLKSVISYAYTASSVCTRTRAELPLPGCSKRTTCEPIQVACSMCACMKCYLYSHVWGLLLPLSPSTSRSAFCSLSHRG